jgi:hypothetical protein
MSGGRKLAKLIRLLASDKDGEVIAAVSALNRALQADGLDIHQLAEAVERTSLVPPQAPPSSAGGNESWRYVRGWCARHKEYLSERDQAFIASLAHWRGRPSEKQLQWLLDVEQRIRRKKQF